MTGSHMTALTEQLLDVAVRSEGEQRLGKLSEKRFEDHGGDVDVTEVVKVHRFSWSGSDHTNSLLNVWTARVPTLGAVKGAVRRKLGSDVQSLADHPVMQPGWSVSSVKLWGVM